MDPFGSCLDKLIECIVASVCRQFGYVIQYKRNISDLDSQIASLINKRSTVELDVKESNDNMETILPEVKTWLHEVDKAIQKKETIFGEESVSKAWCCNGCCPNLMTCHYLGRTAKKMTVDVQKLLHEADFPSVGRFNRTGIAYEVGGSSGTSIPTKFESRISIFRNVMDALKDNNTNPVIIYGMSGLGKSTMLKEIRNSEEAKSLFGNNILLVEVSRSDDYLDKLQLEFASLLGLKCFAELPNFDMRAKLLSSRVKSQAQNILLILDDVCDLIDFSQVGIPLGDKWCKVLISTRFYHLYSKQTSTKTFTLNFLPMEEAWELFKKMAGDSIESTEFRPIAEKVLGKCDGLPIAISAMGRALKDEKMSVWKDALRRLEKPAPGNISEEQIHKNFIPSLKFCYDCLQTREAKALFFLCSLYPEGRNIQVEDLVRHGLGLGLFANIDLMVEGRNCVDSLIDKLRDRSLLLDSNRRGCVKMHDLVRSVALLIDSPSSDYLNHTTTLVRNRFFVSHGPKLIDGWIENCEATVAKPYNSSETLFLLLSSIDDSTSYPPEDKLKVLDFKSKKRLLMLPTLPKLRSIQTLRLENWDIGDASIIGELKTLMILSLRHSSMNELPLSFRNLSNLWLLDLTACRMSNPNIISSKIISSLDKLQELYMLVQQDEHDNSTAQEVNECYEVVSELLSWRCHLTTLEVNLPEVSPASLHNIQLFDKLERFKISIGCNSGTWNMAPSHNNCLGLNVDATSLAGSRINEELLKKTQSLDITIPVKYGECRDGLESIEFNDGNTLEGFVNTTLVQQCHWLPVLHSVTVESQKMLMSICNSQHSVQLFQKLRCVKLHSYSLSFLFALSMARDLDQLEELDIRHCSNLKEIVATEGEGKVEKSEIFKLPNLIRLHLEDLESFSGFSRVYIGTPLLINIQLMSLPKLIALYPNNSAHESSSSATTQHLFDAKDESLLQLRIVNVIRCRSVSSMFSSSSTQSLQNLELLSVEDCQSLESLFNFEDTNVNAPEQESSTLSCIEEMRLISLPQLEYVWTPLHRKIQAFQNLRILKMEYCWRLKYVFASYTAEGLVSLEELSVMGCHSMKEIVCGDGGNGDQENESSMEEIVCGDGGNGDQENKTTMTNKFVFPRIKSLELKNLSSLVRFCGAPFIFWGRSLRRLVLESLPRPKIFTNHSDDDADVQSHVFNDKDESLFGLESLEVIWCSSISSVFSSYSVRRFQNLECLVVGHCQLLMTVFDFGDVDIKAEHASVMLSCLKKMRLQYLPLLEHIWKPHRELQAFQNLRSLEIYYCHKLKYVFTPHIAEGLVNLEEISISKCKSMEEIICGNKRSGDQEDGSETESKIVFPQLKSLEFSELWSLVRVCGAPCIVKWRLLRRLVLKNLRKFINLSSDDVEGVQSYVFGEKVDYPAFKELEIAHISWLKEIWRSQIVHHSSELRNLRVEFCKQLLVVIPSHMQQRLQKLVSLKVSDCSKVEDIFEHRGRDVDKGEAVGTISLTGGNAHPICGMDFNQTPSFQNLRDLKVSDCKSLRVLLSYSMAKGLVKLENLSIFRCSKIEEIISEPAEGEEAEDNMTILPQLTSLELAMLPRMTSFSRGKYDLHWGQMVQFVCHDCPSMETFYSGSARAPNLKEVRLYWGHNFDTINDPRNKDLNILYSTARRTEVVEERSKEEELC